MKGTETHHTTGLGYASGKKRIWEHSRDQPWVSPAQTTRGGDSWEEQAGGRGEAPGSWGKKKNPTKNPECLLILL